MKFFFLDGATFKESVYNLQTFSLLQTMRSMFLNTSGIAQCTQGLILIESAKSVLFIFNNKDDNILYKCFTNTDIVKDEMKPQPNAGLSIWGGHGQAMVLSKFQG